MVVVQTSLVLDPGDFRPAWLMVDVFKTAPLQLTPSEYRHLYAMVGTPYGWFDRTPWTDQQLGGYLARPGLYLWGSYWTDVLCGYVELKAEAGASGQIIYLGLFPGYEGRGMGKHLLSLAIQSAWDLGCLQVRVSTLSTDGLYALSNYLRRGFRVERQVHKH
ncbi:GNAT family N-acetyltransferase [Candidatus Cyanaurora vandensis]|uniref:GNAT family N-acetyltransferase n=1 Tax=Candidatus Cyanaurora vandensis TaxID=2714958 RepID=UPI00257DEEBC|nr:GNAT family N-acetyltransferase [Candidatus Cyanaurora vandensis]